jgi:hypothetical protein
LDIVFGSNYYGYGSHVTNSVVLQGSDVVGMCGNWYNVAVSLLAEAGMKTRCSIEANSQRAEVLIRARTQVVIMHVHAWNILLLETVE